MNGIARDKVKLKVGEAIVGVSRLVPLAAICLPRFRSAPLSGYIVRTISRMDYGAIRMNNPRAAMIHAGIRIPAPSFIRLSHYDGHYDNRGQ